LALLNFAAVDEGTRIILGEGKYKMSTLSRELVEKCRSKLLLAKAEILNRVRESRHDLYNSEDGKGGDEGDQTLRALAESEFLSMHERLRKQLMEIESALARIDKGLYGICEETEEPIEPDRLLAIPWTRLSIEGAEIRESLGKKYAR
jgi:DnaK suppressor protein